MKYLLLPLALITLACNDKISTTKGLTQAEIDYLRNQSVIKCTSENEQAYTNFKNTSDDIFFSTDWNRGNGYQYEYKLDGANSGHKKHIRVWKRDQNSRVMYYYVTETTVDDAVSSYFLRFDETENDAIIDKLLDDHCKYSKFFASAAKNGPVTVRHEYYSNLEDSKTRNYTDTYTFQFGNLAFIGGTYLTRSLLDKDADGNEISGTSKKYTTAVIDKDETFDAAKPYNHIEANGSNRYTQNFCSFDSSNYRLLESSTANPRGGFKMTCSNTLPAGWDLSF